MNMSLGFGLQSPVARKSAPWWHAYRDGTADPTIVVDGEGGHTYGASWQSPDVLTFEGGSLDAGFTLYARGRIDYTFGGAGFPRLVEIGTAGNSTNRHLIFIAEVDGRVRASARTWDAAQFTAVLSPSAHPSGQSYRCAVRFFPNDYAATMNGGTIETDNSGTLPPGLNRIFVRSTEGSSQNAGFLEKLVIWTHPVTDQVLQSFDK